MVVDFRRDGDVTTGDVSDVDVAVIARWSGHIYRLSNSNEDIEDMNQETNSETPAFWPRPLGTTAEHFRPTWQQWRDHQIDHDQLDQGQPPTPEMGDHHFSPDIFTSRELNRLRFLRWLVSTGRLTP